MRKEVILVPKDKCPLDVLAEMGKQIRNSWIFLHENAYRHLIISKRASRNIENCMNSKRIAMITWEAPKAYTNKVFCEVPGIGWGKIISIETENISFGPSPDEPEYIYFLKMDE